MNEPRRPLLAKFKEEIGSLGNDLRELAELRWQLLRIELHSSVGPVKWLAITLLIAVVVVLVSLPLLAVAAAWSLHGRLTISFSGWLLIFGFGLLCVGIGGGFLAWRRFRQRFAGLEQSLEELREDIVWLKDWAGDAEDESD